MRRLRRPFAYAVPFALAALVGAACGDDGGGGGDDAAATVDGSGAGHDGPSRADAGHDLASRGSDGAAPADLATTTPADLTMAGPVDMAVGPPPVTTSVSVIVEPDDGASPILSAISGAKSSVHLEIYYLSDSSVISALKSAAKRGLDVKVMLEQHPQMLSNQSTYTSLQSGGVSVAWANEGAYNLTHEKSFIIDGKTLLVMTLNLDNSGLARNREYALLDTDPADAAQAEAIFAADWAHMSPTVTRLVVSPDNSSTRLRQVIGMATGELDVEWEELSDNQIGFALQAAHKAGATVKVIVPTNLSPATMSMVNGLKAGGVEVRTLGSPYPHAKMLLVDRSWGFVGSENATATSLATNRELGALWRDANVASRIGSAFDQDWSAATPL